MFRPVVRSLFACVSLIALASCSDYLSPVKSYLEEYTNNAAIGAHTILTGYRIDPAAMPNLPSASEARVRFLVRNPQNYALAVNVLFDDPAVRAYAAANSRHTITQAPDGQSFVLAFDPLFLREFEGGGVLSASLSVTDTFSGREFLPPYHVTLVSNSAPPAPRDSRVMISNAGTNVVCFNLDLSDAVHGDIETVLLNGTEYRVQSISAGAVQSLAFAATSAATTTAPSGMRPHPDGTAFVADPAMTAVYVVTDHSSASTRNYLVSVRDGRGLVSSTSLSSNPNQLGQVIVTTENGDHIVNPPEPTIQLPVGVIETTFTLTGAPGSRVHWSYVKNSTTFEEETNAPSPHTITLTPGTYELTAFARMPGYQDSDPITVSFTVLSTITEVYVNPVSGSDTNTGITAATAVRTITRAVELLTNKNDAANTIRLMSDITANENANFPNDLVRLELTTDTRFTLEGNGHTIDGGDSRRCFFVSSNSNAVQFIINDLTITRGRATDTLSRGAGIYFNAPTGASSLTLSGCTVTSNTIVNTASAEPSFGGGVYASCRNVTVADNSTISSNSISSQSSPAFGAGLYATGSGTVNIEFSKIENNDTTASVVSNGAGLCLVGTNSAAPITGNIINSTVQLNDGTASNTGNGGGIFVQYAEMSINGTTIDNNTANTSNNGNGGGVYAIHSTVSSTSSFITNNKANRSTNFSAAGNGGGIYFYSNQDNHSLRLTGTEVTGNNCSTSPNSITTTLAGAGIFVDGAGTNVTEVWLTDGRVSNNNMCPAASSCTYGLGGGIYLLNRVGAYIAGTAISNNCANNTTGGIGLGGGIYIDSRSRPNASLTIYPGTNIFANVASSSASGSGGGMYLKSEETGKIDCKIFGGTIQGNYAVDITPNGTGYGGGIYATSDNASDKLSITMSGGSITNNWANTTASGIGYGGGIYSGKGTFLTISGGTISENISSRSGASHGDGIQVYGESLNRSFFNLSAAAIEENHLSSTKNEAVYVQTSFVTTTLTADARINENALFFLETGALINISGYLTHDIVARLNTVGSNQILLGDTTINYFKFLTNDPTICVNASGRYSTIEEWNVTNYNDLATRLSTSTFLVNGNTIRIKAYFSSETIPNGFQFDIPSNANIRFVPTGPMNLTMNRLDSFVTVAENGHFLFGSPDNTTTLTFIPTAYRTGHTFNTGLSSSLVLRNVRIQNAAASPTSTPSVALVNGGTSGTIVLEGFEFLETTTITLNSNRSALLLGLGNICYFVSGSITDFTNNPNSNTGGFANLSAGAQLHILSGTFSGNSVVGVSSVTGTGSLTPVGIQPQ